MTLILSTAPILSFLAYKLLIVHFQKNKAPSYVIEDFLESYTVNSLDNPLTVFTQFSIFYSNDFVYSLLLGSNKFHLPCYSTTFH